MKLWSFSCFFNYMPADKIMVSEPTNKGCLGDIKLQTGLRDI